MAVLRGLCVLHVAPFVYSTLRHARHAIRLSHRRYRYPDTTLGKEAVKFFHNPVSTLAFYRHGAGAAHRATIWMYNTVGGQ